MPTKKKSTPKKTVIEEVEAPEIECDLELIQNYIAIGAIMTEIELKKKFKTAYFISAGLGLLLGVCLTLLFKTL